MKLTQLTTHIADQRPETDTDPEKDGLLLLCADVADIHQPVGQLRRAVKPRQLQLKEDKDRQVRLRTEGPINSCTSFTTQLENHKARVTADSALLNTVARHVGERVDERAMILRRNWSSPPLPHCWSTRWRERRDKGSELYALGIPTSRRNPTMMSARRSGLSPRPVADVIVSSFITWRAGAGATGLRLRSAPLSSSRTRKSKN